VIDHLSLGVSDLARAIELYDAILRPLGYVRLWTSDKGAGYGVAGADEPLALIAVGARASAPGGGWHLALTAHSRLEVDQFHQQALERGALDEGAPGIRSRYGPGYYAAFIRDADGHKLEAVYHEKID
jgi:catechol 2,3-dioxygenase-like lactoylglutathione lyase family enzyme